MEPSLDDVKAHQFCMFPGTSVHVAPESVDVQMFPTLAVAASLVPSLDDVMKCQPRTLGSFSSLACVSLSVQAALTEASEANKSNTASRTRSIVF